MKKSTLYAISLGTGIVGGVIAGMCIKKAMKNKPVEAQQRVINKTKDVAVDALFIFSICAIVNEGIKFVDDKIRMNAVIETLHYHHTGFFDEESSKHAVATLFPTLSRKAKKAVYPLVQAVFPDLVEVK